MVWIVLLILMILIGGVGAYRKNGEGYSAGRGFFRNSEFDISENDNKDFSDFEPFNFTDMMK